MKAHQCADIGIAQYQCAEGKEYPFGSHEAPTYEEYQRQQ